MNTKSDKMTSGRFCKQVLLKTQKLISHEEATFICSNEFESNKHCDNADC